MKALHAHVACDSVASTLMQECAPIGGNLCTSAGFMISRTAYSLATTGECTESCMQTTTVQCASQAEAAGRSQGYSPSSDTSRAQSQLVVLAVVGVIAAICMAALIVSFAVSYTHLTLPTKA